MRFDTSAFRQKPLRRNPPEQYQLQAAGEGFTESTVGKGLVLTKRGILKLRLQISEATILKRLPT